MGDASWQFCWRGFCLLRTGDEQRADDGATLSACALSGQAKRLEAICIALTGDMQRHYDVYYRVHAQSFGWLGWAENGAPAGTAGYAKRLEGIEIRLVPKGRAVQQDPISLHIKRKTGEEDIMNAKWKQLVTAILMMALLLGPIVSMQTPVRAADGEDDNTFIVGFDAEFPPYGYKDDNGEYVGFDLDLAQEVCDRNGWTLKKQPIEWNSKDMELNSGSISCIWNGFTMNGREDDYTWTKPYVDNSQVVVVRKDSGITQLNDLSGKVVAVQADSSALAALTGEDASEENKALCETFKDLQQVGDYNSAFMNLESGAVNAICMDIGVANYEIESRGDKFMMLEDRLSSEEYGIGFKKGNTELRDKVQATLLDMLADGTFEEIAEKWGLEESICLSPDDQVQDGNAAAATATDTTSTGKKNTRFWDKFCSITKQLAEGLLASLLIFFLTLLFSLPLGLLVAAGRMCKIAPIRWLVKFYISIARGTPLMLQLLVVFYGPYYLFGATLTTSYRFQAVIIGFALNYAAYFAEIYRSGIQAVPQGQHEAAKILGYSKSQTFFKIVFPQMAKNILPSVTNEVITLVKDTSLAFAISYTEMFTLAKQVAAAQTTIMPLFIAGVFYYIFNFVVAFVMEKIEKRMNYYR
jgi:His/Glu/Gln/Arg/opine family amino acid ABC transporter permease subunit